MPKAHLALIHSSDVKLIVESTTALSGISIVIERRAVQGCLSLGSTAVPLKAIIGFTIQKLATSYNFSPQITSNLKKLYLTENNSLGEY